MKTIHTKYILKKMDGTDWENPQEGKITIGYLLTNILSGKTSNPTRAWLLGKRIATEDIVDLLAEDVVFIKQEIEKNATAHDGFLTTIGAGQIIEILDAKEDTTNPKLEDKVK